MPSMNVRAVVRWVFTPAFGYRIIRLVNMLVMCKIVLRLEVIEAADKVFGGEGTES